MQNRKMQDTEIPKGVLLGGMAHHSYLNGFRNIGVFIGKVEQIDSDLFWIRQGNENSTLFLPVEYARDGSALGMIDWEFELDEGEYAKNFSRISMVGDHFVRASNLQIERPSILDAYPADLQASLEKPIRFYDPNKVYLSGVVHAKVVINPDELGGITSVGGLFYLRQTENPADALPIFCTETVFRRIQTGQQVFVEANLKPQEVDLENELPGLAWLRAFKVSFPGKNDIKNNQRWMHSDYV